MTDPEPKIAVITVNWNGWRDTVAAFRSLQLSGYRNWIMIVVDNASSDDSVRQLSNLDPRLHLVPSTWNSGFAGGTNIGIEAAISYAADYVFLLNNDATVRPDTLSMLVKAARAQTADAVLGCVVRFKETGELQFFGSRKSAARGTPDWFKDPADRRYLDQPLIESDFIFGAALFAPLSLFQRVGPFDERYFLTFEETDWCYRARAAGADCLVVRDAVVDHAGSASMGDAMSPLQAYFLQRNRLLFCERHASRGTYARVLSDALRRLVGALRTDLRASWPRPRLSPTHAALWLAIRDYGLRRFGNCPDEVRKLRARAASLTAEI